MNFNLYKMEKITEKGYRSFAQIYKELPERNVVQAPKTAFVKEIAGLCMCSTNTVRMWIQGVQNPDLLKQKLISEKLGIPPETLFPAKR